MYDPYTTIDGNYSTRPMDSGEMIGRLTGKILEKNPDGMVLVDVGGVGFEVLVPPSVATGLKLSPEQTTLFIHLSVRDDSVTLYGLSSRPQLIVFKLLLQVKNIGPKNAMSILSSMKPEEVAAALQREDVSKFKSVPGIGKKTSEMIIIELRDKIRKAHIPIPSVAPALGEKMQEVASALAHLGFRPPEIQKTLGGLKGLEKKGSSVEEIIREALSKLAR